MPTESIEVSGVVPATPEQIYDAWLDAELHAAMTGGSAATVEGIEVGGRFTAGDGYMWGRHLVLEPGRRIVQAWRSKDFPAGAPDSRLEVVLDAADGGTWVTIRHHDVPEGQGAMYRDGWEVYYLEPMRRHFGRARPAKSKKAVRRPVKRKAAKAGATRSKAARSTPRRGARRPAGKRPPTRSAKRAGTRRPRRASRKRR